MKVFWMTFTFSFMAVMGFNLYVDKDYRFYRNPLAEQRKMNINECLDLGHLESDRLVKYELLKHIPSMDVLFMGSSRVSYVDKSMIKDQFSFYNASFSLGLLEDYIATWQMIKKSEKPLPKFLVIFIDHWDFNQKTKFRGWNSIPAMKEFLLEQGIKLEIFKKPWRFYTQIQYKKLIESFSDLSSFTLLQDSIDHIRAGRLNGEKFLDCKNLPNNSKAFLVEDGHGINPFYHPAPEEVAKEALRVESALQFADPWIINHAIIDYFKLMLADARKNKVQVILVTPLWHPISLERILTNTQGKKVFDDYFLLMNELANSSGVPLCQETSSELVGCSGSEFTDSIHMNEHCSQKLLKYCATKIPGLGEILK